MKVFEALYNPMIHESGYITISIHKTLEGAKKAAKLHRKEKQREFNELYNDEKPSFSKFGQFEDWKVREREVLE